MPPRLHPDRPLTNQEKQARRYARTREQRAYIAALEAAVRDARDDIPWWVWEDRHAPTIARARGTTTTTED
jgi:hypothetical protein